MYCRYNLFAQFDLKILQYLVCHLPVQNCQFFFSLRYILTFRLGGAVITAEEEQEKITQIVAVFVQQPLALPGSANYDMNKYFILKNNKLVHISLAQQKRNAISFGKNLHLKFICCVVQMFWQSLVLVNAMLFSLVENIKSIKKTNQNKKQGSAF